MIFTVVALLLVLALALDVYWLSKQQTPPTPIAVALLLVIIVELLTHYPR